MTDPGKDHDAAVDATIAASSDDVLAATGVQVATARRAIPPGTRLEDVYEVKRLLGAGGMGAVYLVEHVGLGKEFALKIVDGTEGLDADAIARLRNEARVASAVEHENIVSLTHLGWADDGNVFLVMELLRGEDLADRLARQRASAARGEGTPWLPDAEVRAIVEPVLTGLSAAHAAGVVHRDLKPGNIVLAQTSSGLRPKIVDFGIGKLRRPGAATLKSTGPGKILGTPLYMAPEQARSTRDADERADIYSLGVVAFEMTCGDVPFQGKNVIELLFKVTNDPPPDPCALRPDLPRAIADVILRALAKDPADRFGTAAEMRAAWIAAWAAARTSGPGVRREPARILCIEDDPDFRANVAELLEAEGFVAITASSGEEGVRLAISEEPDLVLCDVTLPGLDGYGVIATLAADDRTRDLPFIFLSAMAERASVRRGMTLGADDYLTKPFARAELLDAIRTRLGLRLRRSGA